MELHTENTKDITIFFTLFIEVLAKVSGKEGYIFNPRAFICDEGGANFTGLKEVYGKDFVKNHVFSCQWHFMSDTEKKAKNIPDQKMREKFLDICKKLTTAATDSKYNIMKSQLDEMAKIYPTLHPWIKWWDARRSHIFTPFHIEGLPRVNLSEMGNARWKPKGGGTLRLVTAAKKDIATMMMHEKELHKFNRNEGKSTGRGPSKSVRDATDIREQIRIAEEFVNILEDDGAIRQEAKEALNLATFIPEGKAKHKPPNKDKFTVQEDKSSKKKTETAAKAKKVPAEKSDPSIKAKKKPTRGKNAPVPEVDYNGMIANLILAEVQNTCQDTLNATSTNPKWSQHPTSGTLNNYVPKNPPIIINPEDLGIQRCAGCKQPILLQIKSIQTTCCSRE